MAGDRLHMVVRDALRFIVKDAIERGDHPDYVDEILETGGYEITTRKRGIGRTYTGLVIDAANFEVFPHGCADEAEFFRVYEVEGREAAAEWFHKRLPSKGAYPGPSGREWRRRIYYVPTGTLLAERHKVQEAGSPRYKKDGKVRFL